MNTIISPSCQYPRNSPGKRVSTFLLQFRIFIIRQVFLPSPFSFFLESAGQKQNRESQLLQRFVSRTQPFLRGKPPPQNVALAPCLVIRPLVSGRAGFQDKFNRPIFAEFRGHAIIETHHQRHELLSPLHRFEFRPALENFRHPLARRDGVRRADNGTKKSLQFIQAHGLDIKNGRGQQFLQSREFLLR